MRLFGKFVFPALLAVLASGSVAVWAQDSEARARELVKRMTLDEKVQELHGIREPGHFRYVPGVPRLGIPAFQRVQRPGQWLGGSAND